MSSWICSRSISKVGHSGRLLFSKGLVWKACSLGAKWGELKHRLPFSICKGWAWVGNVSWSASCREKLGELHPPPTPPPPHPKKKNQGGFWYLRGSSYSVVCNIYYFPKEGILWDEYCLEGGLIAWSAYPWENSNFLCENSLFFLKFSSCYIQMC